MKNFVVGELVAFQYKGKLRVGEVKGITNKVVTLYHINEHTHKSYSLNKIGEYRCIVL